MTILMTGVTAGIGLEAARRLIEQGHALVVGARTPDRLPEAIAGRVDAHPLDLESLESVHRFADRVAPRGPFAALVLNAGIQAAALAKTGDGFERTFAVNHLAHFLLLQRLLDRLAPGGRVVVTASGVHDPAEKVPFPPPPKHADAHRLAFPEEDPQRDRFARIAGGRAYSASKLANVMTVRELARRRPDLASIAFDPAYVPKTSLAREAPSVAVRIVEWVLPKVMGGDRTSTIERSGDALARLAVDPEFASERGAYWSVRGVVQRLEPSDLARDPAAAARLWEESAALVAGARV